MLSSGGELSHISGSPRGVDIALRSNFEHKYSSSDQTRLRILGKDGCTSMVEACGRAPLVSETSHDLANLNTI